MTKEEELHIIEQVKTGETNLFSKLIIFHSSKVLSLVKGIVGNSQDAEDIAQDVFVKAYFSISKFRGESSFSTWLFRIAYNMSISNLRTKKREKSSSAGDLSSIEDNSLYQSEEKERKEEMFKSLYNAIDQLEAKERFIILAFYNYDKSIKEISEITGMSESNVKVKLHRIKKQLNKMIVKNKSLCYG